MVSSLLLEGVFAVPFKRVLVSPLLKPLLDPIGQFLGKVIALQLQKILDEIDYLDSFQSGFRP